MNAHRNTVTDMDINTGLSVNSSAQKRDWKLFSVSCL